VDGDGSVSVDPTTGKVNVGGGAGVTTTQPEQDSMDMGMDMDTAVNVPLDMSPGIQTMIPTTAPVIKKKNGMGAMGWILIVLAVVCVFGLGYFGYRYYKNKTSASSNGASLNGAAVDDWGESAYGADGNTMNGVEGYGNNGSYNNSLNASPLPMNRGGRNTTNTNSSSRGQQRVSSLGFDDVDGGFDDFNSRSGLGSGGRR
jgi:hypothetical protein